MQHKNVKTKMAACVYIKNPFKTADRVLVNNIELQNTISLFKKVITDTVGIHAEKQELIYNGGCMEEDERSLSSYGVENNVTIFVYEKVKEDEDEDETIDDKPEPKVTVEEMQIVLNKARNTLYKQSVKKLIKNEDSLKKAIKIVSIPKSDNVTAAFLRDPDLLLSVFESGIVEKLVENYTLCVVLKSIVANSSMDLSSRSILYQDDDEESDYLGMDSAYLAQAELLAGSNDDQASTSQQQRTPQTTSSASSASSRHQISASDLANALSFASMAQSGSTGTPTTTTAAAPPPPISAENQAQTEAALEQMRAMGITDDDLSRRALTISGGVVEAAVNLIFEGTLI